MLVNRIVAKKPIRDCFGFFIGGFMEYDISMSDLLRGFDIQLESETAYFMASEGLAMLIDSVSGEIYMMETLH